MQQVLRTERKFLINAVDMASRRHSLAALLHEDPHNGADGYLVRSLYFDTPCDGDYFDKEFGVEVRRKLRLRVYGPREGAVKLEMKQKQGQLQRKRSLRLAGDDACRIADGDLSPLLAHPDPFAAECYALMRTRCYRPKVIVEYLRRAFIAKENNIRVTFDHRIDATASNLDLFDPHLNATPVLDRSQAVMEVKYDGFLLSYIKDMMDGLGRSELSASKYCMARQLTYHGHL